jgi:acyl carrier protein
MNTIDDFMAFVEAELGLPVTAADATRDFDGLADWDSMHLLALISAVERRTGRSVSLADALEASNLAEIYRLTARA